MLRRFSFLCILLSVMLAGCGGRTAIHLPLQEPSPAAGWTSFRGNAQSTGRSSAFGATGSLRDVLGGGSGSVLNLSPVVATDGSVYVVLDQDNVLLKYFLYDGRYQIRWYFTPDGPIMSSPAIAPDGTVIVCTTNGYVYGLGDPKRLDDDRAEKKWTFFAGGHFSSPLVGPDGTVYIGSDVGALLALRADTGMFKWWFRPPDTTPGSVQSSPALGLDGTIYFATADGFVYAVKAPDLDDPWAGPTLRWAFSSKGDEFQASPAIGADGTVYIGSTGGYMYALDGATGTEKWSVKFSAPISSPAIGRDGTVYIGSWLYFMALDGATGQVKWSRLIYDKHGYLVFSSPAIAGDGTVYVAPQYGDLLALNGATGDLLWWYPLKTTTQQSSPVIGPDGTVFINSTDGNTYAIK
jgi:outer membrane protein assembly factor BamB